MNSRTKRFTEASTTTPSPGGYNTANANGPVRARSALGTYGNSHARTNQATRSASNLSSGKQNSSSSLTNNDLVQFLSELGLSDTVSSFDGVTLDDMKALSESELNELLKDELKLRVIARNKITRALLGQTDEPLTPKPSSTQSITLSEPEPEPILQVQPPAPVQATAPRATAQQLAVPLLSQPLQQQQPADDEDLPMSPVLLVEPPRATQSYNVTTSSNSRAFKPRHSLTPKRPNMLGYDDDDDDDAPSPAAAPDTSKLVAAAVTAARRGSTGHMLGLSAPSLGTQSTGDSTTRFFGGNDDDDDDTELPASTRLFPRPFFGTKLGEYPTRRSYEAAKSAIKWAREQVDLYGEDYPLPAPALGSTFVLKDDVEFATSAIIRTWLVTQYKNHLREKLTAAWRNETTFQFDPVALSKNATIDGESLTDAQIRRHLIMPTFGSRVGEYSEMSDFTIAKHAVRWARTKLLQLKPGISFPEPQVGEGGVEAFVEENMAKAKRAIMWSLVEAKLSSEATDVLALPCLFQGWPKAESTLQTVIEETEKTVFDCDGNQLLVS